jgi:dienelactone hydrolase
MSESPSQYFARFYTSQTALAEHFRRRARRPLRHGSAAAVRAWQPKARRKLSELLGIPRFRRCAPKARKIGSTRVDGITREDWLMQVEPGNWMPFYLLIPEGARGRMPLVLCPHGHLGGGRWATAGRRDIPEMVPAIEQFNYDYGMQFARAGFIAACPDARGFGQRREPGYQNDREEPRRLFTESCYQLLLAGAPLGMTVQGMWTWDLMRLLDVLAADPRVDPGRVGCAGLSGGGLQTLNLAALDRRVKAAVVSGYFYGVRDSLQRTWANCMCNVVPGLWEHFDMGDIGALIAPRGLFIETGDQDHLNGTSGLRNVRGQVGITRRAFRMLSRGAECSHHVFAGGHRWNGTRSIPWLVRKLLG